jgi:HopA1 effector protein family
MLSNFTANDDRSNLVEIITEIATTIEIKSFWQVDRSGKPIIFFNPEKEKRLQQLPKEIRERYLSVQLRNFLIAIYFQGSYHIDDLDRLETEAELKNRSGLGVRSSLFQNLDRANCGSGFFDADWLITDREDNGLWAVSKQNLTVHIKSDLHLRLEEQTATVGDRVSILMPNHIVEKGAYVAIGNAGNPFKNGEQLVNLYLNISGSGAIVFLSNVTQELNNFFLPFRCKFLYDLDRYERYDTGVLTVTKADYSTLEPVIQKIYRQHHSYFREGTPLFTQSLARGMAIAEIPQHPKNSAETFADDRFQLIVDGLLTAWQGNKNTPQLRREIILQSFAARG